MGNLLSRLSRELYIHSATQNFVEIASEVNLRREQEASDKTFDMLLEAKERLEKQIRTIQDYCNQFYKDIGITERDDYAFLDFPVGTVISTTPGGYAWLDGAKAFERKYLMGINMPDVNAYNSLTKKLLNIMNTQKYQQECIKRMKSPSTQRTTNLSIQKSNEFKELVKSIAGRLSFKESPALKKLLDTGDLITTDLVTEGLKVLTQTKKGKKSGGMFTTVEETTTFKKSVINNIATSNSSLIKSIFLDKNNELLRLDTKGGAAEAIKNFEGYFLRTQSSDFANILWEVLLDNSSSIQQELQSGIINEQDFISYFEKVIEEYGNIDFSSNIPQFTGFQLEKTFTFGMNLDFKQMVNSNNFKVMVRDLGQTRELKTYKDGTTTNEYSGSDMVFDIYDKKGNVIKSIRIQAKNSFQDNDYLSIRLQDKIKLETYAHRLYNEEDERLLEYIILNRAFLKNYGLKKGTQLKYGDNLHVYGTEEEETYRVKMHQEWERYVLFFLNQTLGYLVGGKVIEQTGKWDLSQQNLFFIYKGKYFIPVSLFLLSAYNLVMELLDSRHMYSRKRQSIGELTFNANLEGIHSGFRFAVNLRNKKFNWLNNYYKEQNDQLQYGSFEHRYPTNLVEIGSQVGREFLETAKFPAINFRMRLKKIDELLGI